MHDGRCHIYESTADIPIRATSICTRNRSRKRRPVAFCHIGYHNSVSRTNTNYIDRTKSPVGRQLLKYLIVQRVCISWCHREWLLRPLLDARQLKARLDTVQFFLEPANFDLVSDLRDCLRHIKKTSRVLARLRRSCATVNDWHSIYQVERK